MFDALKNKIQMKSRAGTGSSSESSPCSLTFDFAPSILTLLGIVQAVSRGYGFLYPGACAPGADFSKLTTTFSSHLMMSYTSSSGGINGVKKSSDGKTIYWYGTDPTTTLNYSGNTYYFIAIG